MLGIELVQEMVVKSVTGYASDPQRQRPLFVFSLTIIPRYRRKPTTAYDKVYNASLIKCTMQTLRSVQRRTGAIDSHTMAEVVAEAEGLTPAGYRARVVDSEVRRGLRAAGCVVLEGPRACGKTWTGLRFARSVVRLDTDVDARVIGAVDPSTLLEGASPRLLDEWQFVPMVWNHVRHACDASTERGLFILAGSAQPADDITRHTGAGRARRIRMRPMSLFESSDSTGEVSVSGLLENGRCRAAAPDPSLRDIAGLLCRGGWPGQADLPLPEVQQNLRDYLTEVAPNRHSPPGEKPLARPRRHHQAAEVDRTQHRIGGPHLHAGSGCRTRTAAPSHRARLLGRAAPSVHIGRTTRLGGAPAIPGASAQIAQMAFHRSFPGGSRSGSRP